MAVLEPEPTGLKVLLSSSFFVLLSLGVTNAYADESNELQFLKQELRTLQNKVNRLESNAATKEHQKKSKHTLNNRVAGVEAAVNELQQPSPLEQAFKGVSVGASFVGVGQNMSGPTPAAGQSESQLNYRADLEVEMPLGEFHDGETTGVLFTHFRMGQGSGVNTNVSSLTGAVNSTAFQLSGAQADNSTGLLAQMWYQLGSNMNASPSGDSFDRLEVTVGKIDPFVFFDNNAIADDESEGFLNNVFVHNAQLDSGGDVGADEYGFSPGVVAAYVFDANNSNQWQASFGLFGAGNGATFNNSLRDPFSIVQLQYDGKALGGLPGTYQLYAWNNPQAENAFTAAAEAHNGLGISFSQQLNGMATAFSRIGLQTKGNVNFDANVTGGLEFAGSTWGRAQDRLGVAVGALFASDEYKAANPNAGDEEINTEVFYTYQINDHLHVSPHLIYVNKPGARDDQEDVTVLGVRTKAAF